MEEGPFHLNSVLRLRRKAVLFNSRIKADNALVNSNLHVKNTKNK